jgi:hypothetical protein
VLLLEGFAAFLPDLFDFALFDLGNPLNMVHALSLLRHQGLYLLSYLLVWFEKVLDDNGLRFNFHLQKAVSHINFLLQVLYIQSIALQSFVKVKILGL